MELLWEIIGGLLELFFDVFVDLFMTTRQEREQPASLTILGLTQPDTK